jgi:ribosomal protein S27E
VTDLDFVCPRCSTAAAAPFYGPCTRCRAELVASLGGEARVVEVDDYTPKVNVTPNAVATKD